MKRADSRETGAGEAAALQAHMRILKEGPIATVFKIGFLSSFYSGPIYKVIEPEYRLARPEFNVLICLQQMGELTATQIIEATGQPRASVSRAVVNLVRDKRITARPAPNDGRSQLLTITTAGRRLFNKVMPRFLERQQTLFSVLTVAERAELERLLSKLAVRDDGWSRAY